MVWDVVAGGGRGWGGLGCDLGRGVGTRWGWIWMCRDEMWGVVDWIVVICGFVWLAHHIGGRTDTKNSEV